MASKDCREKYSKVIEEILDNIKLKYTKLSTPTITFHHGEEKDFEQKIDDMNLNAGCIYSSLKKHPFAKLEWKDIVIVYLHYYTNEYSRSETLMITVYNIMNDRGIQTIYSSTRFLQGIEKLFLQYKRLKESNNDPTLRMYILVNTDLKMTTGKIAGQCCHAACSVTRDLIEASKEDKIVKSIYERWLNTGETKIILKANKDLMNRMIKKCHSTKTNEYKKNRTVCIQINDLGKTQIPKGSLTAVAFYPMKKQDVPVEIRLLHLL